jgi:hypothetical protein
LSDLFKSTKTSLGGFIDRMKQKTAAVQASTAAEIKDTVAIKNKTKALAEQQAAAAAAAGTRRNGAGSALMGAGFAAQGLISGAMGGGMTTGSALTTLGGAMMFIPGGMIAGLVVGIVGAIVQGFEAADKAARDKMLEINAKNVQITAERVETATAQITDELAQLMSTGRFDYDEAMQIINDRRAVSDSAAAAAGVDSLELDKVRLAFQNAGVKANSEDMKALLAAAAKYSSKSPDSTADQITQAILSVYKDKSVQGVVDAFGSVTIPDAPAAGVIPPTAPFAPGASAPATNPFAPDRTQQDIQETGGKIVYRDIPATATTEGQLAAVKKILNDPKSYTLPGTENKFGFNVSSPALNSALLAGFDKSIIAAALTYAGEKNLKKSTMDILQGAIDNKPIYIDSNSGMFGGGAKISVLPPSASDKITGETINSLYGGAPSGAFNFSTGKITTAAGVAGQFTTSQIAELKGSKRDPSIVQLIPVPDEVEGIKSIKGFTQSTANALNVIAGLAGPDGTGLKVIDLSPKDSIAPQIMIAPGMTQSEQQQIENLNKALRAAFAK